MALVVGDIVTPATSSSQDQEQIRGVVAAIGAMVATDIDVLWDNGLFVSKIPDVALDRLVAPDPGSLGLFNRIVRRVVSPSGITASAAYDALVINIYKRENAGAGVFTPDLAWVKTQSNEQFQEIPASVLEIVSGS